MSRAFIAPALLVLVLAASVPAPAFATFALPDQGPAAPVTGQPLAVVTVLEHEVWSFTTGWRGRDIEVPQFPWNRVVLMHDQRPDGDPWDRLFAASVSGVEVLRGTTPRTSFAVQKDVTRYAALLPPGGTVRVEAYTGTGVPNTAQIVTLRLLFYDEPTPGLQAPADHVQGVARFQNLCVGNAATLAVSFPGDAPSGATVELFTSGHADEEFWYLGSPLPRTLRILVDGEEVARAIAMPYVYAFLGLADEQGYQTPTTYLVHEAMWWSAHRVLNAAGLHTGNGEIPPYRASVDAEQLHLLAGARTVEVAVDGPGGAERCRWVTSASFLLHT